MVATAADLAGAATVEQVMARQVVLSSHEQAWRGVEVMQALLPFNELRVPGLGSHTVAINLGRPFVLAGTVDGRASTGTMGMFGAKIVPAGAASDWRWAAGESLNMLHLSVPEPFVREIAIGSDLNPDTLELVERIGILDPQIERIGLALLEELRADGLAGRLYAESLAVILAVIWDPARARVVKGAEGQSKAGYTLHEDRVVIGWPTTTISRGEIIYDKGQIVVPAGRGQLVRRGPTMLL